MRIRLSAAATIAACALSLTACSSGSTVTDTPKAAPVSKSSEKKPAAKKSKAPDVAKIGDIIALKGTEDGSKLDVTVVKMVDPAKGADEFTTPSSGKRFVGIQFRLVNTGTATYSDSPSNGAQISDADGQQFQTTYGEISAGPAMSSSVKLKPGAKALGWIVFEVPKASKAATVQFAMDSGFADQSGEWKLS
ncbi:DUF4352 domain-containing protein [Streptomyces sp. NBC_00289]|uniref:DUF4352 domain-containing protein n=1 Tax=Streptomyces sp. NBC_00289 TaxID=2975703 RepID=UPI0032441DAC